MTSRCSEPYPHLQGGGTRRFVRERREIFYAIAPDHLFSVDCRKFN